MVIISSVKAYVDTLAIVLMVVKLLLVDIFVYPAPLFFTRKVVRGKLNLLIAIKT